MKQLMGQNTFRSRCLILAFASICISCNLTASIRVVERSQADSMRTVQVVYHNRVCPINTPATQFTQQLTGKNSWKGLSPEQVMLSWALYPEDWKDVAMIRITDPNVCQQLGIHSSYARFADFFDEEGNYRLPPDKYPDIDERLTLVALLTKGELYHPLSQGDQPLSDFRIQTELLVNAVPWYMVPPILCFILTCLLFVPRMKKYTVLLIIADISILVMHLLYNT
ncbi:MAG: hypothetical protein IJ693_06945 [Bacteroidaceae bacterium]|nr:hypothetical protein [Bacteroidaceae bacterium]